MFQNLSVRCTVNPVAGRELEYPFISSTLDPKKYTVVGGGPAGMEAARVLATAGHNVTLFEKERYLGGQIKLAAVPPGKDKIYWSIDYLQTQIHKLGVDIRLNTECMPEQLVNEGYDAVILATGAAPIIPGITGVNNPNVATAWDILAGSYETGNNVVIIGGGNVGCETGLFLKSKGVDVTIVETLDTLAYDTEPISRAHLLHELQQNGVHTVTNFTVYEIKNDGVVAMDTKGQEHWIPCTHVVLAAGAAPVNNLENELKQRGMRVFVIGDAKEPRKLNHAIFDGFMAAHRIIQAETFKHPYHPFHIQQEHQEHHEYMMQ